MAAAITRGASFGRPVRPLRFWTRQLRAGEPHQNYLDDPEESGYKALAPPVADPLYAAYSRFELCPEERGNPPARQIPTPCASHAACTSHLRCGREGFSIMSSI